MRFFDATGGGEVSLYDATDLFAGPGGWDEGARQLGLRTLGIENDPTACLTRHAAGLPTLQADVRHLGPSAFSRTAGFLASPPCQTFSAAGKGAGRQALEDVLLGIKMLAARQLPDDFADERTGLVLEPLRWILEAKDEGHPYRWVGLEQVPTVLPVWLAVADVLRDEGYSATASLLHAEQYGVPQTRKRAVLLARLDAEARLPTPTHSRYHSHTPTRLDPGVLPWVSMAEALGFAPEAAVPGNTDWVYRRPSPTIIGSFAPQVVAAPGYRKPGDPPRQKTPGSVRITTAEAAVLQSFPKDYPWRGSKTRIFQQIGNAVPPRVAVAVLRALTDERQP